MIRRTENLPFNADGLLPAIAQQVDSGEVLMLAWMNREAILETLSSGRVCYWSRSRQRLWRKVETSGHHQTLKELRIDCDGDTLLLLVDQQGAACHTRRSSCFYHAVRGDLARILGELAERRESGDIHFERVIIQTPGLADPAPVAQTFFVDPDILENYALDAIITVVDAKHAGRQLAEHHEAQEQVGFADRILLSKTDLVEAEAVSDLENRLRIMNPGAPIKQVHFGQTELHDILDIGGFDLEEILKIEPDFLEDVSHEHDDAIGSLVYRTARPFDFARLLHFMDVMIGGFGQDLLRYKGILNIAGNDNKILFQGVHMLMGDSLGKPCRYMKIGSHNWCSSVAICPDCRY